MATPRNQDEENDKDNDEGSTGPEPPTITTSRGPSYDPVQEQKKKDAPPKKKLEVIPEKESIISAKIQPSVGTRIGLQYVHDVNLEQGQPRLKYVLPISKRQRRALQRDKFNFCKYGLIKLPEPNPNKTVEEEVDVPSPEVSSAKVAPRKVTPTASWLYPDPQTREDLDLKRPKSGIFINVTGQKEPMKDYDSFDLVYSRKPRPDMGRETKRRKSKRKRASGDGLEDIIEEGEEGTRKKKRKKKKKKKKKGQLDEGEAEAEGREPTMDELLKAIAEEQMAEEMGEGEYGLEDYLTKQFRRKVSQISKATSYQSRDLRSISSEEEILEEPAINKYIQKFRRESEIKRYVPKKRKFRRGTLESHSFTRIVQPKLRDFFFGSKEGTMHQGDEHYPESIRNKQGLCMSVAAYCFSILKHPNLWTAENIDEILEIGNSLCLESIKKLHMHDLITELKPEQLLKYCVMGDKKIRFKVDEPEVSGFILSDDKTVYNLTKGLKIFFARQKAGILKTQDISIAMWKDKYYYLFDARPRTKDLYRVANGTAIMANFYDVPSIVTVLLERSDFENWPFVIYNLKAFKVLKKDDPEIESTVELDVQDEYNIMDGNKAVVMASFELGDKCFDFTRNKQALTMAAVCLVYSRITPPSAWHKTTLDKIMIIGNQLYLECMECESIVELRVDSLPAMFTIGPYIVEIYVYMNMYGDLMFRKCCCQLKCTLQEFFERSTNAIVQIGKFYLAVWKQRNMYYCFDPYSRNGSALKCRDGAACVSMHSNLESLVSIVAINFDNKEGVFYVHGLKVCKIHRDPVQSARFPKHLTMDDFPVEDFKKYKMKKSRKPATEKPVTVDYSALAMRRMLAGESPQASIFEIGSTVESLGMEQIPPMVHKFPSRSILKRQPKVTDVIADLDSPSLSDTQIEPPPPEQPKVGDDIEFMDLDSFELTQEEIELQTIEAEAEFAEAFLGAGDYEGMGEGEEDLGWYYAANTTTQVGEFSLPKDVSRISEQVNTDITYFPINKEVLYPTYLRGKQQMRRRLHYAKTKGGDDWDVYFPVEPTVTKSEELKNDSNFLDLPDDTQIIYGTKNVADFGEDVEFIAPFVCIMAAVVSRKYAILSWTTDIVDYVMKCGNELYGASKFRYDQVAKMEIPRITLGTAHFKVLIEYVFDTYTRQNILELAIEKILFVRSDMGVLVTPSYACALIYKNHLYYLYDPFGNNEVGLSEGPSNTGIACFARFKDIHSLATRIMYNKTKRESSDMVIYTRFVLSSVKVKNLRLSQEEVKKKKKKKKPKAKGEEEGAAEGEPEEDMGGEDEVNMSSAPKKTDEEEGEEEGEGTTDKKKVMNKVGYQYKDGIYVIEGTKELPDRQVLSEELKPDHFVSLCACLMLLTCPINKWDTRKVNQVIDHGQHVFSHADDLEVSEKRTIKNVLIQKNFFDIIVKRIKIENWRDNKKLNTGIDTLLKKRLTYFIVQFPNASYVIHKSSDDFFHLFDPYGFPNKKNRNRACWVRCQDLKILKWRLKKLIVSGGEGYSFYNFEVTSIRKAPKELLISHKLEQYDLEAAEIKERLGKPFYEDVEWLKVDPIPWSRRANKAASGGERGNVDKMWHNWDIEYPKDLFSIVGNIHQTSDRFSETSRGKQTLANLVVAIGMKEIYRLAEWNSAIIDSILVNGDNYFIECTKDIAEEDYELSVDDLKEDCSIFPFAFKVAFNPVVEGTMFLVRLTQFNLYKALRYFFNNVESRWGIICVARAEKKRQVAFGKIREFEYFVFDSDSFGAPMFVDNQGAAYALRMTTLNRLLHVLTLTLRGGDFYIYEVEVTDLKPIS